MSKNDGRDGGTDVLLTREEFLPFFRPTIEPDDIQAVVKVLESGWLTTGPVAREFEDRFAQYVGGGHAVAANSATAGLHLALEAIGLREGDEVLVPAFTFTATAEVVCYLRARPVLVDCDPVTFNIDPRALEARVTARTRAIVPVHFAGQPCDMDPILQFARSHDLVVIEDAAHALPARYRGKMVGSLGDTTVFSFYATKTITTGEGGMIVTDHEDYSERMRMMCLHGMSRDAWKRYTATGSWYYEIMAPGFKYNMPDILAALGLQQLQKCERFYQARQRYAAMYTQAFTEIEAIVAPQSDPRDQHAWHLYVILLRPEMLRVDRGRFIQELAGLKIGASVHFIPLHLHPYYQSAFGYRRRDFPHAEWVYDRCVSLPIYPGMSDADLWSVVEAVDTLVKRHRR